MGGTGPEREAGFISEALWQYYPEQLRLRRMFAIPVSQLETGPSGQPVIPEGFIRPRGEAHVIPVSVLTEGSHLARTEAGETPTTWRPEQWGKREKLLETHEQVRMTGLEKVTEPFRGAGPLSRRPDVSQRMMAAYVIGGDVGPSGQAYLDPFAGRAAQRISEFIKEEEARRWVARKGARWGPGKTFQLASGAEAIRTGKWTYELKDIAPTEGGYQAVLERTASIAEARMRAAELASKHMVSERDLSGITTPEGKPLGIHFYGGIKDIQGVIREHFRQMTPAEASRVLGIPERQVSQMSYRELGRVPMEKFEEHLLEKYAQTIHETATLTTAWKEKFEASGALVRAEPMEGDLWQAVLRRQALVMPVGKTLSQLYPTKAPFMPHRQLEALKRQQPEEYRRVMAEGAERQFQYRELLSATLASAGRYRQPAGLVGAGEMGLRGEFAAAALAAETITGAGPGEAEPRAVRGQLLRQLAAGEFAERPIALNVPGGPGRVMLPPQGRGGAPIPVDLPKTAVLPSPKTLMGFTAWKGDKLVSRYAGAAVGALAASASGASEEEARMAMAKMVHQQEIVGRGGELVRKASGVFLERAVGGPGRGSMALHPGEAGVPGWGGQAGIVTRAPGTEAMWGRTTQFLPEEELIRRGINPREETYSVEQIQSLEGDVDGDVITAMSLGLIRLDEQGRAYGPDGRQLTGEQEILAAAQEAVKMGAADILRGETAGAIEGKKALTLDESRDVVKAMIAGATPQTEQQIEAQIGKFADLQQQIGPIFNVTERMMATAPEFAREAVGQLRRATFGRAQRPAEQLPSAERVVGHLALMNLWSEAGEKVTTSAFQRRTGGPKPVLPGGLRGVAALQAGTAQALMGLRGETGERLLSGQQFAALMGGPSETQRARLSQAAETFFAAPTGESAVELGARGRAMKGVIGAMGEPQQWLTETAAGAGLGLPAVRRGMASLEKMYGLTGGAALERLGIRGEETQAAVMAGLQRQEQFIAGQRRTPAADIGELEERVEAARAIGALSNVVQPLGEEPRRAAGSPYHWRVISSRMRQSSLEAPRRPEARRPAGIPAEAPAEEHWAGAEQGRAGQPPPPPPPSGQYGGPQYEAMLVGAMRWGATREQTHREIEQAAEAGLLPSKKVPDVQRWLEEQHLGGYAEAPAEEHWDWADAEQGRAGQPPPPPAPPDHGSAAEPEEPSGGRRPPHTFGPKEVFRLGAQGQVYARHVRATEEHVAQLQDINAHLERWGKKLSPLVDSTEELTGAQRTAMRDLKSMGGAIGQMSYLEAGDPDVWKRFQAEQGRAVQELPWMQRIQQRLWGETAERAMGGGGGGFWQRARFGDLGSLGRAAGGLQRLTSGWELMRLKRLWSLTGAPTFERYMPTAAQADMAAWQAAQAVGGYGGPPEGVAGGLMQYQAAQRQGAIEAGRAGYQAWGWTQQGAGFAQKMQAVFGPAAGIGLVGGSLAALGAGTVGGLSAAAAATTVGLPVTLGLGALAGLGAFGAYSYNVAEPTIANQVRRLQSQMQPGLMGALGQGWEALTLAAGTNLREWGQPQGGYPGGLLEQGRALMGQESEQARAFVRTPFAQMEPDQRAVGLTYMAQMLRNYSDIAGGGAWSGMDETQIMKTIQRLAPFYQELQEAPEYLAAGQGPEWLRMAAATGMGPEQFQGPAAALGLGQGGTRQLFEQWAPLSAYERRQRFTLAQQYAPLGQMGAGEQLLDLMEGGQLPQLDVAQQRRLQQFAGGNRYLWSQMGRELGVPQAVTMEEGGLPVFTTGVGAEDYTRLGLQTEAAREGMWGIQAAQRQEGIEYGQTQRAYQRQAYEQQVEMLTGRSSRMFGMRGVAGALGLDYFTPTPDSLWGLQDQQRQAQYAQAQRGFGWQQQQMERGQQRWGLGVEQQLGMSLQQYQAYQRVQATGRRPDQAQTELMGAYAGGMWGLQDQRHQMQYAQAQRGFGWQQSQMEMGQRHWMANFQLGQERWQTGVAQTRAGWGLQEQQAQLGYAQAMGGVSPLGGQYAGRFAFQEARIGMGLGHFMQGQDLSIRAFELQQGWRGQDFQRRQEDLSRQYGRGVEQRGWTEEDWAFQEARGAREWGWQMEDYGEAIRFATGRQRKRLITQRERATIRHGEDEAQIDRQQERQEQVWAWEDEDFERTKDRLSEERERNEELADIQRERFEMQRRHAEENAGLAMAQLEEQKLGYEENYTLAERQRTQAHENQEEMWSLDERQHQQQLAQRQEQYDAQVEHLAQAKLDYEENFALAGQIRVATRENQIEAWRLDEEQYNAQVEHLKQAKADYEETFGLAEKVRALQREGQLDSLERQGDLLALAEDHATAVQALQGDYILLQQEQQRLVAGFQEAMTLSFDTIVEAWFGKWSEALQAMGIELGVSSQQQSDYANPNWR